MYSPPIGALVSLQTPKNVAEGLLRELPTAVEGMRKEANFVDWKIQQFLGSDLLQGVGYMEILETIREVLQKDFVLVTHNFDIEHRIIIALLDSNLMVLLLVSAF